MTPIDIPTRRRPASGRHALISLLVLLATPTVANGQTDPGATDAQDGAIVDEVLKPGDAIRLSFWREPDLNGDYIVDETHRVILPILGATEVSGIPASTLKENLVREYDRHLRNQQVQILVLRRVRILGAVESPGLYHVDPTMTLGDVVALAGGANREGKLEGIRLLRDGREIRSDLDTRSSVLQQIRSGDQVIVPERSWLSRNGPFVIGAVISALGFIIGQAAF